jgi:hypothetical protein
MLLLIGLLSIPCALRAQFPPGVGEPGTTAMHADSSAFREWATDCTVTFGYINFVDTTVMYASSNKPQYGIPSDAIGKADNKVVSIGDRGIATLTLPGHLYDDEGPDFAVFENAFSNLFLELAYVEVSSNGYNYVRFPGISLTQNTTQIPTFGTLDPTQIHNFGGKYLSMYGTPFDLADLQDSSGIDLGMITHIRIVDVGGCIMNGYQSFDSQGNVINDPWPTPFHTSGFDLDAVGIINIRNVGMNETKQSKLFQVYPNPFVQSFNILNETGEPINFILYNLRGEEVISFTIEESGSQDLGSVEPGLYLLSGKTDKGLSLVRRIIKQ